MKLPIAEIQEGENQYHYESEKDAWVKPFIEDLKKEGTLIQPPVNIDLNFTKLDTDLYLRGVIKFNLEQNCSRCAETTQNKINQSFELAFSHIPGPRPAITEKLAEESEEVDVILIHGPEILLEPIIKEQVILAVPYQSFCKPDCKGLCQECGKNLNLEACNCAPKASETPFSVLKTVKL